jgi:hypothetical protein
MPDYSAKEFATHCFQRRGIKGTSDDGALSSAISVFLPARRVTQAFPFCRRYAKAARLLAISSIIRFAGSQPARAEKLHDPSFCRVCSAPGTGVALQHLDAIF